MHATILISTWLATPSTGVPSLGTLLLSALIIGFLMLAGTWFLNRSRSAVKPSDRILTKETDDKGVPLFFDLDSYKSGPGTAARAAGNTRAPRR
jgi:hypothetical protein